MVIYFGADHRGFALKERLKNFIHGLAYEVADMGAAALDPGDDYTVFASEVAKKVAEDPVNNRGILICGSGVGVDIVANKFDGVRSALGFNSDQIYAARHDDDVNALSLAADHILPEEAEKIAKVFLLTAFGGEPQHARRIDEIRNMEHGN